MNDFKVIKIKVPDEISRPIRNGGYLVPQGQRYKVKFYLWKEGHKKGVKFYRGARVNTRAYNLLKKWDRGCDTPWSNKHRCATCREGFDYTPYWYTFGPDKDGYSISFPLCEECMDKPLPFISSMSGEFGTSPTGEVTFKFENYYKEEEE